MIAEGFCSFLFLCSTNRIKESRMRLSFYLFFFFFKFHVLTLCTTWHLYITLNINKFQFLMSFSDNTCEAYTCCSPAQIHSLGSIYYPSHHSPTLKWQGRVSFKFSLDWCKIALRLPSHRFSSVTHSSGSPAASAAPSVWWSFISLLRI